MNYKKSYHFNIYLSARDYKALNDIKNKYHLSYSTITYIVLKNLNGWFNNETEYRYKEPNSRKTHIKIRNDDYISHDLKAMYVDNILKMFLRGELRQNMNEGIYLSANNMIYNEFQNTYDENWDGNQFNRRMAKWIKHNREYAKKVLENE